MSNEPMSNQTLKNLQQATHNVTHSQTPQEKIESLSKAFEMFSMETSRLEIAYNDLKEQFKNVNLELEDTNKALKGKILELDLLTYYLNSILSNISQGIIFIDLAGNITTYNRAAEKILQVKGSKVLFENFWTHFKDDLFGFSIHEVLESKKSYGTTLSTYITPKGEAIDLEIDTTIVLRDEDASKISIQGIIILFRDITEIRRLQSIALRNDRLKELGEMAAQVAHEIRNPLGGIKGFASLLKRDLEEQPALKQMAEYIVEGTDNLNRLVTQVLNYARPLLPQFEKVDLVKVLEEMKYHVEADANFNPDKIKLSIETDEKTAIIQIDPQLIKGALLNLMVNSLQAMPDGGKVILGLKISNGLAIITVSDTGIGIPAENLKKLYSPFFTTKTEGNGFGLAEVHKVVQAFEGTIEVESKVGKGTTFTIKLPLTDRGEYGNR